MKTSQKTKLLFLTFSSLIVPVAGEMIINKEGLPTPWLFSLIEPIITLYSIASITLGKEKIKLLDLLLPIYTIARGYAGLFGSWNSLRVYGIEGFQYLGLSWLITFSIIGIIMKLDKADPPQWESSPLTKLLRKVWSSVMLIVIPLMLLTYFWNIVSLGIYGSLRNFSVNAQFLTNCTKIPTVPWQTIIQCNEQTADGISCFLGSKNIWIIDLFCRALGMILCFFPLCYISYAICANAMGIRQSKKFLKRINYATSITTFSVTSFYLISMAIIQSKGLSTQGLEGICDINYEILSSKTGYVQEWFGQEWTSLKQIALV